MPKKKVTDAVEETAQETIPVEKAPAQMPRRQGSEDLLELNDLERGVTREDSEEAKWGYLAGAVRRQQILTGIVSAGMTYTENGMPIVPIDFEGLCVKIPVREMTLIEWPEDEPIPRSLRIQIGRMLGATIDFIPAGVDFKERAAIGSRKAAMLQRQKRYYASGRVKPGILMACRVLTVGNNTMMVEACGVDTEIYARNVSWEWFSDIADLHSTGDLVVARILDVTYNEQSDTYAVNLSIKDASENPDRAALEKIVPNSNYFGVVTGVKDRVFFVRLQAGVNAKTKLYRSIDMPSRLDNGISLNGLEYLKNDADEVIYFAGVEAAKAYLREHGVTEDEMEDMVFRKSVGTCFRCGDPLFLSDIPEYSCQCFRCDEDFYSIEQDDN